MSAQKTNNSIIKLDDGNEYTLTRLDMNGMIELEDEFDAKFSELLSKGKTKFLRALICVLLRPKHADLTAEQIGHLVTPRILINNYDLIVDHALED